MSRRLVYAAVILALSVGTITPLSRPAHALPKYEIDTTYYDACRDEIFERVVGCLGEVYTWGTSSAGAVYKNVVEIGCDDSEYYSFWYQWNGSSWTLLSGMPAHC
jgi:hypothetical protein